jgi:site-specific recombinase XerD
MGFDGTQTGSALKGRKFPQETLTEEECTRLIAELSRRSTTGVRNRALLVVLWRAGLRISEALNLRPSDLDPETEELTVLSGKRDKRRTIRLDSGALAEVLRWRDRREGLDLSGHRPLFCTLKGGRLSPQYVRALLRRLAAKAGIEKRVHPHALRHTFAAELVREGQTMPDIRDALGHDSLATTDTYLRDLAPSGMRRPPLQLDE